MQIRPLEPKPEGALLCSNASCEHSSFHPQEPSNSDSTELTSKALGEKNNNEGIVEVEVSFDSEEIQQQVFRRSYEENYPSSDFEEQLAHEQWEQTFLAEINEVDHFHVSSVLAREVELFLEEEK